MPKNCVMFAEKNQKVTGGFNFQNAWTTGWLAGLSMSEVGQKTDNA